MKLEGSENQVKTGGEGTALRLKSLDLPPGTREGQGRPLRSSSSWRWQNPHDRFGSVETAGRPAGLWGRERERGHGSLWSHHRLPALSLHSPHWGCVFGSTEEKYVRKSCESPLFDWGGFTLLLPRGRRGDEMRNLLTRRLSRSSGWLHRVCPGRGADTPKSCRPWFSGPGALHPVLLSGTMGTWSSAGRRPFWLDRLRLGVVNFSQ